MNLNQRSSRYGNAVLFSAGVAACMLIAASIEANFKPAFEIWLASALVVVVILYARAGFALSRARQELELLRGLADKFPAAAAVVNRKPEPDIHFKPAAGVSGEDSEILQQVKTAIENDRIDLYLQPIVSLPQRKFRFFEAFSRLRAEDGQILKPAAYLDAAERANRIGVIDNMILLRSVQALRNLGPDAQNYRIFCNISPATIYDKDFFARFSDFLDVNADLASRLVFEFTYPAIEMMHGSVDNDLEEIASRGFVFSVDHIRRFDLNWKSLRERNFRFVKASSAMLLAENRGDDTAKARVKTFRDRLLEHGIDLIVEKVELESHVPEIVSLGIDFGQGELFGAPRPASFYISDPVDLANAS
ncbi:MAG: EAL domain-containing protein [Marinicaulis sp.]|nr:EAL domain-containing protein [Marinicaulis sp.]NNL90159.1 EAL domain-containing protein [Marinicaulis sp.]